MRKLDKIIISALVVIVAAQAYILYYTNEIVQMAENRASSKFNEVRYETNGLQRSLGDIQEELEIITDIPFIINSIQSTKKDN